MTEAALGMVNVLSVRAKLHRAQQRSIYDAVRTIVDSLESLIALADKPMNRGSSQELPTLCLMGATMSLVICEQCNRFVKTWDSALFAGFVLFLQSLADYLNKKDNLDQELLDVLDAAIKRCNCL